MAWATWFPVAAATLEIVVTDGSGAPAEGAVGVAVPVGSPPTPRAERVTEFIDQIDKEFVPEVRAIRVGTAVSFPNKDNIRHHVYSFSPAKKFELALYKGVPAEPVVFDQAGLVVLGCNIHDWMIAYLYVFESPWFGVAEKDGAIHLRDLPPGEYDVQVYHPRAKDPAQPVTQRASSRSADAARVSFRLALRPPVRRSRPPRSGGSDYP